MPPSPAWARMSGSMSSQLRACAAARTAARSTCRGPGKTVRRDERRRGTQSSGSRQSHRKRRAHGSIRSAEITTVPGGSAGSPLLSAAMAGAAASRHTTHESQPGRESPTGRQSIHAAMRPRGAPGTEHVRREGRVGRGGGEDGAAGGGTASGSDGADRAEGAEGATLSHSSSEPSSSTAEAALRGAAKSATQLSSRRRRSASSESEQLATAASTPAWHGKGAQWQRSGRPQSSKRAAVSRSPSLSSASQKASTADVCSWTVRHRGRRARLPHLLLRSTTTASSGGHGQ